MDEPDRSRGHRSRNLAIGLLLGALLIGGTRTLLFRGNEAAALAAPPIPAVPAGAEEHLAAALRFATVSDASAKGSPEALGALVDHLERTFPRVFAGLAPRRVGASLRCTWTGTDSSLPPALLMGHLDVVPVEPGTEGAWEHPPFAGLVTDGFVHGRGALDDKGSVIAILEAVELLLAEGFVPRRTLHLAFGHDEEIGGNDGAKAVAAGLAAEGTRFAWVLDEGGMIVRGAVPGVERPVAFVGIAEKGYVSVSLEATAAGGHSSMPPDQTAIGIVAAAAARLEESPMPLRLSEPTYAMLQRVGPEMPFGSRFAVANVEILEPLLLRSLAAQPKTNASVRTTTAVTMIEGGTKDNVLPAKARAVVNFRILPGDTVATVLAHVRDVVDDERVQVEALPWMKEPSRVSPVHSEGFRAVEQAIRQVFPEALVAPYLVLGATDAHHYEGLTEGAYRFAPFEVTTSDLDRIHGTNERVSVASYAKAVSFYMTLMKGN